MTISGFSDEELSHRAQQRRMEKQQLLERVGCAPPGKRDMDLEIGDPVRCTAFMTRRSRRPAGQDRPIRFWKTRSQEGKGWVVGARTLQSGAYVKGYSRSSLPEDYVQPYLEVWRTHRVYLVSTDLWSSPAKVLSDDLGVIDAN